MSPEERIIVALDKASDQENIAIVEALKGRARWFKIGMRQYYAGASRVFDAVRDADAKVFLDLKVHDIPATVAGAMESLAHLAPDLITIHAAGGGAMVRAAVDTLAKLAPETRVLAVTILTSMEPEDVRTLSPNDDVEAVVLRLARRAVEHGAHGIVASPLEAAALRPQIGDALIVTPGVRPAGADLGDQQRVMTPRRAIDAGSDYLVIGRPIHGAPDPLAAFEKIVEELR